MAPAPLPSAEEIVARESRLRRIAAICTWVAAVFVVAAFIVEILATDGIPNPQDDGAVDLVEAFAAQRSGGEFPTSFWVQYAQFRLDHDIETILTGVLRGLAVILWLPAGWLLVRGARERGGQLARFLEPLLQVGLLSIGVALGASAIAEISAFRSADDGGLVPNEIVDQLSGTTVSTLTAAVTLFGLLVAAPLALGAIQAMRVGLLPRVLGFMGVLAGLLFFLGYDAAFLVRGFWFAAVGVVLAGAIGGLRPAWQTGEAVEAAPRQPPELREPKPKKSKRGDAE